MCPVVNKQVEQTYLCDYCLPLDNHIPASVYVEEKKRDEWWNFYVGSIYVGRVELVYDKWIVDTVSHHHFDVSSKIAAFHKMHELLGLSEG